MRPASRASAALPDDAPHLLVVDDDRRIRALLSRFLFTEGYRVTTAETAADARAKLQSLRFDLLILDVMMPGETGFDLARHLRASSSVPIIMLTARDETHSRIEGLTIGADDYVGKPFEPRELSLRIAGILRRARPAGEPPVEAVRFGDFHFHMARGELKRGEDIVRITDRERDMLRLLAAAPGRDRAARGARRQWRHDRRASGRCAGQSPAPQDRGQSGRSAAGADRARGRIPVGDRAMTTLDFGIAALRSSLTALRSAVGRFYELYDRVGMTLKRILPTGLYARALLIIIVPMVVLQSVVAFMFMERHYQQVSQRMSAGVAQDIATLVEIYKVYPQDANYAQLRRIAQETLGLVVDFLPANELPPPGPKPFFSLVDQALSDEVRKRIGRPFWIDTVGRSSLLEVRIKLDNAVMRVFAPRSAAFVSNSHIFLVWMVATSLVLITVAVLFLRNQIRPILRLADAAESFGKGREVPDFQSRGAREVRRAAQAFIEMKRRIERAIEQRTAMLAGVSHDLRTILTRFKLELALIEDSPEIEAMKKDVDEMARMLEAYLAFARGDSGEQSAATDMGAFLEELKTDAERNGHKIQRDLPWSSDRHRCGRTHSSAASPIWSRTRHATRSRSR